MLVKHWKPQIPLTWDFIICRRVCLLPVQVQTLPWVQSGDLLQEDMSGDEGWGWMLFASYQTHCLWENGKPDKEDSMGFESKACLSSTHQGSSDRRISCAMMPSKLGKQYKPAEVVSSLAALSTTLFPFHHCTPFLRLGSMLVWAPHITGCQFCSEWVVSQ